MELSEHLNMTVPLLALDVRKRDIKDDENVIENWEFKEKQLEKAMEADRKLSGTHFPSIFGVCLHPYHRLPSLHSARNLVFIFVCSFDLCFNIRPDLACRHCSQKDFGSWVRLISTRSAACQTSTLSSFRTASMGTTQMCPKMPHCGRRFKLQWRVHKKQAATMRNKKKTS